MGTWWQPFPLQKPNREGGWAGHRGWGRGHRAGGELETSTPLLPGVHLEGPFISREKRGAHPEAHLRSFETNAFHDVLATYGPLDNVRIVTLAPELGRSHEVIQALTARGICVSLGEEGPPPGLGPWRGVPGLGAQFESRSPMQDTRWPTCRPRRKPCRVGPPSSRTSSTPCCL